MCRCSRKRAAMQIEVRLNQIWCHTFHNYVEEKKILSNSEKKGWVRRQQWMSRQLAETENSGLNLNSLQWQQKAYFIIIDTLVYAVSRNFGYKKYQFESMYHIIIRSPYQLGFNAMIL
jgi:hypothetical protein